MPIGQIHAITKRVASVKEMYERMSLNNLADLVKIWLQVRLKIPFLFLSVGRADSMKFYNKEEVINDFCNV